jgi:hypothetical protein
MTLIPELERELTRAITETTPTRRRSRLWRLPVTVPIAATLAGTAVALAAAGVIPLGSPEHEPGKSRNGSAAPADSGPGTVQPGASELLALKVKDPGSTLPWGLRVARTTRGLGCVRAGLVLDGRLGALGIDGDFANDGRFHPFPAADTPRLVGCAPLDTHGELFISASEADVPTSASAHHRCPGAGVTGKVPPSALCAGRNTRDIYYGLLGPRAISLTYTSGGTTHTIFPQGPHGAYLIILPAGPHDLNGVSTGLIPAGPPITQVTYRVGLTCRFARGNPEPRSACSTPPGSEFARPDLRRMLAAAPRTQIAAIVTHGAHSAWSVTVSFKAPVAITDALTAYAIELRDPGPRPESGGTNTDMNLRPRQRVSVTFSNLTRTGLYTGTVRLIQTLSDGLALGFAGPLVGRFSARIP